MINLEKMIAQKFAGNVNGVAGKTPKKIDYI